MGKVGGYYVVDQRQTHRNLTLRVQEKALFDSETHKRQEGDESPRHNSTT